MKTNYKDVLSRSEWDWVGYEFDDVIHNNGTPKDLDNQIEKPNINYTVNTQNQ